ncbi:mesothelin-like protein [Oryzias melastigma]|uniref:mesothelin-like protein n=1 Tax=Oryzias melastigma TaxID=30732 RepID=UPI00168D70FF|nr:mesothelin-like protein [Oryzias melastigma]
MDSSNGDWDPSLTKTIISKYLAVTGNTLGRAELNAIGGSNLCSLDVSVIKTISKQSLKEADALNVTSCTTEKKQELFSIASQSFRSIVRSSPSYLLTQPYIGGANISYIRSLVTSNVNMDLATFSNLNQNVVLGLTVTEVKSLLGTNLPDLKSYENQTLVQTWIRSQYQSELNTLGLSLSGGRADPVTTATSSPTGTAATTTTTTTTTKPTSSTTKGSGVRIHADAGFSLLVCLALLVTSQLITM